MTTEVTESAGAGWDVPAPFLRNSSRHVHHTVARYLQAQLVALGWTDPDNTPFGATPVEFMTAHPKEWETEAKLEAGKVAITLGDEDSATMEEMGGPLACVLHPIFVDIFMDNESISLALALDVRDILTGRFPGSVRVLPVLDFTQDPPTPVDGWVIELDDVTRVRPEGPVNWAVVKCTAMTYFPEVQY